MDTHAFLWWAADDPRLSTAARAAIADHGAWVSVVTPWEVIVKHAVGRLELIDPPRALIQQQIARHGFEVLPISLEHVLELDALPLHHPDPFDRMLVAQAQTEGLTLVSRDPAFDAYDVATLW